MPVAPAKILTALRNAHRQLIAPINAAEAALTKAERALTSAQQVCIAATKILVKIDKTPGTMIDPLRAQAQAAYDEAQAKEKIAQHAVIEATALLIEAYAVCAQRASQSAIAAMQAVDPEFRNSNEAPIATQPPLFIHKPDIKGTKSSDETL